MPQFRTPSGVVSVSEQLVDYSSQRGWERIYTEDEKAALVEEAAELKGPDLDEALEKKGLPKSGKADEKRARLAETITGDDPQNKES
jgi:hypothetical protein